MREVGKFFIEFINDFLRSWNIRVLKDFLKRWDWIRENVLV